MSLWWWFVFSSTLVKCFYQEKKDGGSIFQFRGMDWSRDCLRVDAGGLCSQESHPPLSMPSPSKSSFVLNLAFGFLQVWWSNDGNLVCIIVFDSWQCLAPPPLGCWFPFMVVGFLLCLQFLLASLVDDLFLLGLHFQPPIAIIW